MKTILRITLLSAIVIASPVHAGTLDTSILDLKVGMPFENARKWVNERIPNAKTRMADQAQGSDGKQFFTYLQLTTSGTTSKGIEKLKADNGFIGETWTLYGGGPATGTQAVGLARSVRYDDGKGPDVEEMRKALVARYGEPSKTEDGGEKLYWVSKNTALDQSSSTCAPDYRSLKYSPDCGTYIFASIEAGRDRLVTELSISILDHDLAISTIAAERAALQKAANEKMESDRQNRAAVPKL
ncbi:hypothetical protein G6L26_008675 [Agrobacterium radiobacter]|nr:hypothetical protein [Agrobacterium tumefaciens]KWT87920.1 hypothetical protein ASB65_19680 [Agrobacterium tumefaciens str. B6]MQB28406.1 hypothetical protein [Agrobacterium tumefaciens]NTA05259.1 hypothetical protein [Agrobacterium tumefaciens]NTA91853.1 hypothetical protein [Agrobacterium tumefaciens]NTB13004.1 hypothetical protein [Agrobacterium tumefaciens]